MNFAFIRKERGYTKNLSRMLSLSSGIRARNMASLQTQNSMQLLVKFREGACIHNVDGKPLNDLDYMR